MSDPVFGAQAREATETSGQEETSASLGDVADVAARVTFWAGGA